MTAPFTRTLVACAAALALAPSGAPAASPAPAGSSLPIVVHIKDFLYDPTPLKIHVNDTVTFINDDNVAHTVTADDKSFDSDSLDTSQTWKHTFTKAGTFSYFCVVHPFMKAVIVVSPADDATAQPSR